MEIEPDVNTRNRLFGWSWAVTLPIAAATLVTGCSDSVKSDTPTSATTVPTSASPTPKAHTLNFAIIGEGRLRVTYVVNGKETTEKAVELPWRKTIHLPAKPGLDTWQLRTQASSKAKVETVVKVDGRVASGGGYCEAKGCTSDDSGSISD
ncbi:hypothetical protein E1287_12415 [Actinomadura sp. KC06]|uniref:hypothetical protein n=1 Tax=Actinomadura sp. KC06 TaxID=2530369 RepID=UPI0010519F47|nr:hypothetical protein [Actinomadura sp. KC06]TDD35968.1 hypothetical protein E1287_12415 [Actinomadura sp. KC06]